MQRTVVGVYLVSKAGDHAIHVSLPILFSKSISPSGNCSNVTINLPYGYLQLCHQCLAILQRLLGLLPEYGLLDAQATAGCSLLIMFIQMSVYLLETEDLIDEPVDICINSLYCSLYVAKILDDTEGHVSNSNSTGDERKRIRHLGDEMVVSSSFFRIVNTGEHLNAQHAGKQPCVSHCDEIRKTMASKHVQGWRGVVAHE